MAKSLNAQDNAAVGVFRETGRLDGTAKIREPADDIDGAMRISPLRQSRHNKLRRTNADVRRDPAANLWRPRATQRYIQKSSHKCKCVSQLKVGIPRGSIVSQLKVEVQ